MAQEIKDKKDEEQEVREKRGIYFESQKRKNFKQQQVVWCAQC